MDKPTVSDTLLAAKACLVSRHSGDDGSVECMLRMAANNPNDAIQWVAIANARRQFLLDTAGCLTIEQARATDGRNARDSRR